MLIKNWNLCLIYIEFPIKNNEVFECLNTHIYKYIFIKKVNDFVKCV